MSIGIKSNLTDFNLGVTPPSAFDTASVIVIGTAEDGPVNVPTRIRNLQDARSIFGSPLNGTLVKSLYELFYSTRGTNPDVRAVRIGGGTVASLTIDEQSGGTGISAPTDNGFALKLTSLYPGEIYNNITIKTEIVNNRLCIVIYNPKTGIESVFTYDTDTNISADVHNANELANAINNDSNLNTILIASVPNLQAYYEVDLTQGSTSFMSAYDVSSGLVELTMKDMPATSGIIDYTRNPADGRTKKAPETALNKIRSFNSIYEPTIVHQLIAGEGYSSFQLLGPAAKITSETQYILPLDGDTTDSNRKSQSEYRMIIRMKYLKTITDPSNVGTIQFSMAIPPNVSEMDSSSAFNAYVSGLPSGYDASYVKEADDLVILYVERDGVKSPINDLVNEATRTNIYGIDWDDSTQKVSITFVNGIELHLKENDKIYIDIDSVVGILTPVSTIHAVEDSTNFTDYFIAGDKIYFGSALPCTLAITYGYKRLYEYGSDVELVDSDDGKIRFINTSKQPGFYNVDPYKESSYSSSICKNVRRSVIEASGPSLYAEGQYHPYHDKSSLVSSVADKLRNGTADKSAPSIPDKETIVKDSSTSCLPVSGVDDLKYPIYLGFDYYYYPEEMDLTSALSLSGGTNGISLSADRKIIEFQETFNALINYPVDIVVVTGAYFDDYIKTYNKYTGIEEYTNSNIATIFSDYLYNLSQNVSETIGIMSVSPVVGTVNSKVVSEQVDRLVNVQYSDPTRPANTMALMGDYKTKHLVVTAFEPIVNIPITSVPYSTTGESIYAGIIMSLKANETPINQVLKIAGMRYLYTNEQIESLLAKRYTVVDYRPGIGFRIAGDPTLAPYGSDYSLLSTVIEVFTVTNGIRDIANKFLGAKNTEAIRNSLQQQVDKYMSKIISAGIINRGVAVVRTDPTKSVLGEVDIDITVVPAFELRTIVLNVKVSAT